MSTTDLVIAGLTIVQDQHGRFNLNMLHHASATGQGKLPNRWVRLESTQELIHELNSQTPDSCFDVVKGGNASGVYAHELLALSYAGWVSPAFQLTVNRAFLAMRDLQRQPHGLPQLHNPTLQMMLDAVVRIDSLEYEQLKQREALLVQQAATIEQMRLTQQASLKADLALAQQLWVTLREYAYTRQLTHQMPLSACKDFGTYLTGYCLEHDIPVRDVPIAAKAWKHEHAYHVELIDQLLPKWLKRHSSQMTIVPSRTAKE